MADCYTETHSDSHEPAGLQNGTFRKSWKYRRALVLDSRTGLAFENLVRRSERDIMDVVCTTSQLRGDLISLPGAPISPPVTMSVILPVMRAIFPEEQDLPIGHSVMPLQPADKSMAV